MVLGSCYSCIKYLNFAFNFLFWILGCAILGVAIWVRVDPNFADYVDNSEKFNFLYAAAYTLIAIGALMMVIGFLGCCGSIRESQCMLGTFFIFLFVIFVALLGAGIWSITQKEMLKDSVTETLRNAVANYNKQESSRKLMDNIQRNLECCGADHSATDYSVHKMQPPKSCKLENWPYPCDERLFAYFSNNIAIISGVAIGVGIVMLLGMLFSILLCCTIREAVN